MRNSTDEDFSLSRIIPDIKPKSPWIFRRVRGELGNWNTKNETYLNFDPCILQYSQDAGFSPCYYWRFDVKPHFWPTRFAPVFARFLSQDTMGVYPVTLSPLGRLSLFGVDFDRGASCDERSQSNAEALKTCDTWEKKKGSPVGADEPF